jgi:hypothetical protein
LGGVVFVNVQSFNGNTRKYDNLLPGYGVGFRIKLNKIQVPISVLIMVLKMAARVYL